METAKRIGVLLMVFHLLNVLQVFPFTETIEPAFFFTFPGAIRVWAKTFPFLSSRTSRLCASGHLLLSSARGMPGGAVVGFRDAHVRSSGHHPAHPFQRQVVPITRVYFALCEDHIPTLQQYLEPLSHLKTTKHSLRKSLIVLLFPNLRVVST